ncbi:MAG: GspE/PulE family protein [Candidatus Moranbacteria bacterium]|jgi:type II secretory ATPase GspE/PulE/Tfp pilus assembly ATPase PilB-like protein|nr:GspE/PulE family protein [Candidatus Moranbacteria bacterium]
MVTIISDSDKKERDTKKADLLSKKLSDFRHEEEEEVTAFVAKELGLSYLDLNIFPLDLEILRNITEEDSIKFKVGIIKKIGKRTQVAICEPNNKETLDYLEFLKNEKGWEIIVSLVSQSSMNKVWKKYKENILIETLDYFLISLSGEDLEEFEDKFKELIKLKERMSEMSTSDILSTVFSGALKMGASDVHFEPQKESIRMRYRIDGVLQTIGDFPFSSYKSIVSRIKMIGKMKLNLRDISQDGHFSININNDGQDERVDIRVSIIPGKYGESIVMRLLNQSSILVDVENLGLKGLSNEQVNLQISKPNGMVLITGPTGSGKTTTLYSFLNKLNTPNVKIITIEDPIEYEIKGISQTQVQNDRGYSFSEGLRAIVRQDPDIILVGEIRDGETAEISVNAALTGHLVFSTLHTNNAPASVSRLLELGVRPALIASSVNIFMAQRLVRQLCPHCKEKYNPAPETIDTIKKLISIISPKSKIEIPKNIEHLYKPIGCPKCNNLGYKGRIGIFETLTINEKMEKLIIEMAGESEITKAALEDGMVTMTQDGILKVLEGTTSMDEVWRVTGQTAFLTDIYEDLMDQSLSRSINISEKNLNDASSFTQDLTKFNQHIKNSNSNELAEVIIASALLLSAGDIHIEPETDAIKIRFRIDGILQDIASIPLNEYPTLLGKIKLLSGLKTGIRSGVEDSRFKISVAKKYENITDTEIDVRVSIILGGYGETVVMRLLNKSATALEIEKLGIRKENLDKILYEISKPNGIILNTGPTGSGKSTTLYSLLKILNNPEVKIITVEDPIEYQLPGILQTQVNETDGYGFSTALRALLRQNPNIIMIGEIRDNETAKTAIQASLTGHLILSTLHTNDAASSVHRLINMDVDSDELATSINAFMAQRLVRKLCDCKEATDIPENLKPEIEKTIAAISPQAKVTIPPIGKIYKPKGCEKCNHIGYKGRTTISEVLVMNKALEKLISLNALSSEIKDQAIADGMLTMYQDGVLKVLEGETTFEEINRVSKDES